MKKELYILLVLIVAFSCNNSSHNVSIAKQNNSSNESGTTYDSIKSGYGGYIVFVDSLNLTSTLSIECKKVKPLDWNGSRESLGDLFGNDTLKLFAEFCQCGEFGGDKEYILIYRVDTNLKCIIIKDSVSCHFDKYYRISEERFPLSESSTAAVVDYLELLLRYSFIDKVWDSNVAGYFSASLERGDDNRKDISMDVYDSECKWIYFDILKHEIKTAANERASSRPDH